MLELFGEPPDKAVQDSAEDPFGSCWTLAPQFRVLSNLYELLLQLQQLKIKTELQTRQNISFATLALPCFNEFWCRFILDPLMEDPKFGPTYKWHQLKTRYVVSPPYRKLNKQSPFRYPRPLTRFLCKYKTQRVIISPKECSKIRNTSQQAGCKHRQVASGICIT